VPHSPEKLALRFVVLTHESSLGSERRGGAAPERALALQHASAQRLDDQREPIRSLTDARWRGGWWGPALGGFALDAVVGSAAIALYSSGVRLNLDSPMTANINFSARFWIGVGNCGRLLMTPNLSSPTTIAYLDCASTVWGVHFAEWEVME
jgi:hypothetical protein